MKRKAKIQSDIKDARSYECTTSRKKISSRVNKQESYTINGKVEMDFRKKYDIDTLYEAIRKCNDIDKAVESLKELKTFEGNRYTEYLEKMKVLFILSDEYEFLSTSAMIFSELKLHSVAPLIVSKLLSGKFDDSGGTFLFCLMPLRKSHFYEELQSLWSRDISWETEQKLLMMGIDEP